jgi:diaminohydroxyphosphoribosylaminopyrimidine deaminase/5-amino-6-(5-phosphoribosylamino)uracil reductase
MKIMATGYHKRAGHNHAEVEALAKMGGQARKGDTLYVTLEPCNHHGRMPPCTQAIIKSGLKRVVIGMRDPNPKVRGGGSEFLEEQGIQIKTGILESECRRLNEAYIKFVTTDRPFVIAKSALTIDGWTATRMGHSEWITNDRSRQFVHRLRDMVDGVMVGIGTVLADNPSLTTRLKNRRGQDPTRIIVDSGLRIPHNVKVLNHDSSAMTLLAVGDNVSSDLLKRSEKEGVSAIVCPLKNKRVDLTALMEILGGMSITSLLVEGGSSIMGSMIRERLIDKFYLFKAPKILGGNDGFPMASGTGPKTIDDCISLKDLQVKRLGDDTLFIGYPDY